MDSDETADPLPKSIIYLVLGLVLLVAVLLILYSNDVFPPSRFEAYISAFGVIGTLVLVLVTAITVSQNQNLIIQEKRRTKRGEIKREIIEGEISDNYKGLRTIIQESSKEGAPKIQDEINMAYSHEIDSESSSVAVKNLSLLKRKIEFYRLKRKNLKNKLASFLRDEGVFPIIANKQTADEKVEKYLLGIGDDDSIRESLNNKIRDVYGRNARRDLISTKIAINVEAEYALDNLKECEKEIGESYDIPIRENKEIRWDDWEDGI